MSEPVPQHILDALTDVDMPRLPTESGSTGHVQIDGHRIPVHRAGCVVVGSGAAGLRAAVELKRRGGDVTVISQSAWGGTSACSGSDKQTLHTANTADAGDDYRAMARSIRSGGAMDEDIAYIEAVGSPRVMGSLQFMGLALPQNAMGATLRYQTDHDEVGRATSCGPRTSRLMVRVLADEALRLSVPFFNHTTAVDMLIEDGAIHGLLTIRARDRSDTNPLGLAIFATPVVVMAAGGPGELYRDSVFPNGCFGSLGLAIDAGIDLINLTESQFGISTRREGFPWNLSGTYVQVIPHIYSLDADGTERHFLADYYRTTQEMASNVFRKGYQWPFHATRMLDFGSSLLDLAVFRETQAGRRVFLDFNRNLLPVPGDLPFSLRRLDEDVARYLSTAGATHALPIDRLRHMNPLAIELYRRYKVDIATDPLEFSVNNQHMNGGIATDIWGQSSQTGVYAVGEAAGTHGVTRPGGSALNAGQVFGTRAAEHIAASRRAHDRPVADIADIAGRGIARARAVLRDDSPLNARGIRADVQARMSDHAGIVCNAADIATALGKARALNAAIRTDGIACARPADAARVLQWRHMALTCEAVLSALDHYVRVGGGSRGARAICDPDGTGLPDTRHGPLEDYRFRPEVEDHKNEQIVVTGSRGAFRITVRKTRAFDEDGRSFFERDWPDWLTGRTYQADNRGRRD